MRAAVNAGAVAYVVLCFVGWTVATGTASRICGPVHA